MSSRCLRSLLLSALCLLVLPAGASAVTYPSITKVSPAKLGVGDTMTIAGKNFRSGKNRNTVVFKRDGGRAIFVKVPSATSTRLSVVVPAKLLPFLVTKGGSTYTRFRIRVLSGRFGKRFTAVEASPLIGSDCDEGVVPDARDTDDDNDLIADATEATLKTSACKRDTDDDGMSDGWEYHSALDRNSRALPFPGSKPYPNALFAGDAGVDHDGDGLTNADEYAAWAAFGADSVPLSYSGGNPTSAGRGGVPPEQSYLDRDGNGLLSDNERDADGDAIANQDEGVHTLGPILNVVGFFTDAYLGLTGISPRLPLHGPIGYADTVDTLDWLFTDTDGDGVPDGADDVDHDDVPNLDELLAELAMRDGLQRPLNACVPDPDSRFCIRDAS